MVSTPVVAVPAPSDEDAGVPAHAPNSQDDEGHERPDHPRRWVRRLLIGLNVVVAVCLIAAASMYGYVRFRFGQIKRVEIPTLTAQAKQAHAAGAAPDSPGAPITVLIVGSDIRANETAADKVAFGDASQTGGQRSDTIMLVHLDPRAKTASLLSIPRDLWVPIADQGYSQRINTAFDVGPDLLIRTIQQDLGIAINHYVSLDFNSFRKVVDALGGVKYWYPEPVKDTYSGLNVTAPACLNLNGDQALALVRARHMQYFDRGYWQFEAESDLARIRRQQSFVKKVVSKAQDQGLGHLTTLNGVIGGVVSNLTVDQGFTQKEMLGIVRRFGDFDPNKLVTFTLPTSSAVIHTSSGDADVLLPVKVLDQQIIDTFMAVQHDAAPATPTTVPSVAPSSVEVRVLNGNGAAMGATTATADLRRAGFVTGLPGDADTSHYPTTVIRYASTDVSKAQYLQSLVVGGAQLQVDPTVGTGLVLVTGASYGGIRPTSTAGAAGPGSVTTT
ncbi:MAG: LCP family protein, partial [Acidimicrobiales bacterium]